MPGLQEWKDVLEKHRMGVEHQGSGMDPAYQGLSVCWPDSDDEPGDDAWEAYLLNSSDDKSAAEFVARVTATVFGEWVCYVPLPNHSEPYRWELYSREIRESSGYKDTYHSSGPTKLDALYDALARKEPQP